MTEAVQRKSGLVRYIKKKIVESRLLNCSKWLERVRQVTDRSVNKVLKEKKYVSLRGKLLLFNEARI